MENEPLINLYFGDPASAVDITHLSDYKGLYYNNWGEYYQPPVSNRGLLSLTFANPYHGTLADFKAKMLSKYFIPNDIVARKTIINMAYEYNVFGNAYLYLKRNIAGVVVATQHIPTAIMRRVSETEYGYLNEHGSLIRFAAGDIWHWHDYSPDQQLYGIPYWYGALHSILLHEQTVLFPRRFFKNGGHAGHLLVTSGLMPKDEGTVKDKVKSIKGLGNFETRHIGFPAGDIDKLIKLIPIGDTTNIDYSKLRDACKKEVCSAWRIRPELAGMMPENTGGSGDLDKIRTMFYEDELVPYMQEFEELSDFLPANKKVVFKI